MCRLYAGSCSGQLFGSAHRLCNGGNRAASVQYSNHVAVTSVWSSHALLSSRDFPPMVASEGSGVKRHKGITVEDMEKVSLACLADRIYHAACLDLALARLTFSALVHRLKVWSSFSLAAVLGRLTQLAGRTTAQMTLTRHVMPHRPCIYHCK